MFSFKFFVKTKKPNTLTLRITNNRKSAELSLGVRIAEETLADAMSNSPRPENIKYRKLLDSYRGILDGLKIKLFESSKTDMEPREIKDLVKVALFGESQAKVTEKKQIDDTEKKTGTFAKFFEEHANRYTRTSTRDSNLYTLSLMRKHAPNLDELDFEDINYAWLSDLEKKMIDSGLSVNTRRIHFANIRAAVNEAYRRELTDADPFRRFKLKTEKTEKRSINAAQLRELMDYNVEPYIEYYRDMFILIFMFIGINTIDLYKLTEISADGRINYRRSKTGRLYSIKVEPEAMKIIERHRGKSTLVNIADRTSNHRYFFKNANKALRCIGEVSRRGRGGKKSVVPLVKGISTYWARHTWATIAAELDIPDATISLALGHAGENRVTDIYIKRNLAKVDAANRKVLDYVLYGKR